MGTDPGPPADEVRELHRQAAMLERLIDAARERGNTAEACVHSSTLVRVQARIVAACPLGRAN